MSTCTILKGLLRGTTTDLFSLLLFFVINKASVTIVGKVKLNVSIDAIILFSAYSVLFGVFKGRLFFSSLFFGSDTILKMLGRIMDPKGTYILIPWNLCASYLLCRCD